MTTLPIQTDSKLTPSHGLFITILVIAQVSCYFTVETGSTKRSETRLSYYVPQLSDKPRLKSSFKNTSGVTNDQGFT